EMLPHVAPCAAHVVLHATHWFALHVIPLPQVPQSSTPPQPSLTLPQPAPADPHVSGVHPQRPGAPPPPQVAGAVHDPQSIMLPLPSAIGPQFAPALAHVTTGALPSKQSPRAYW